MKPAFEAPANRILPLRLLPGVIRPHKAYALLLVFFLLFEGLSTSCFAQRAPSSRPKRLSSPLPQTEDRFQDSIGELFSNSASTGNYDQLTLMRLQRLKEQSEPIWDGDELDYEESRRVARKASAIQFGRGISRMLEKSELRGIYKSVKRTLAELRKDLSLDVKETENGLQLKSKDHGEKLIEFALELDPDSLVEPQVRIGQGLRLRYDRRDRASIIEYGFEF